GNADARAIDAVRQWDEAGGRDGLLRAVDDLLHLDLGGVPLDGDVGRAEADGIAVAGDAGGGGEFVTLELAGDADRPALERGRRQQQEAGRPQQDGTTRSEAGSRHSRPPLRSGCADALLVPGYCRRNGPPMK